MADGMVKAALDKVEEMAFQELKLQTEVGKKVQQLRDELEWLRAQLRHADHGRRLQIDGYFELWVRQTRDVAFDAEDLLEEYFHKGRLHCHGFLFLDLASFARWLRQSVAGLFVRHSICDHIDNIKDRLVEIKKKMIDHDVEKPPETWAHPQKHYMDWSALNEANIADDSKYLVGIKGHTSSIKSWLKRSKKRQMPTVIAITGKSGVGKTILATHIYRYSRRLGNRFDCSIWVHLPQKFRVVDILGDIIKKAASAQRKNNLLGEKNEEELIKQAISAQKKNLLGEKNEEELMRELLAEKLGGKKYLIVLDDVRRLEEWKFFLAVLPANRGSAILITTELTPPKVPGAHSHSHFHSHSSRHCDRNKDTSGNGRHYDSNKDTSGRLQLYHEAVLLKKLENSRGRQMFCTRVFGQRNFPKDFRKKNVHSEAIEKLLHHSLPLAVSLLAGFLRTKKEDEWAGVLNQLQGNNGSNGMAEKEGDQQDVWSWPQEPKQQEHVKEEGRKQEQEQPVKQEGGPQQKQEMQPVKQEGGPQQKQEMQPVKQPPHDNVGIQFKSQPLFKKILMLSFDDLPSYLKQCFLYFAAFKAEEEIDAEKIVQLWVAEGLVQATDGRTMEEHARDCLRMLISRCLIDLVKKDYSNNIITVSIHKDVRDFAMSEARDINFLQVHHSVSDVPRTGIRRLSLQNAFHRDPRLILSTPKLRSLLCEYPEAHDDAGSSVASCYNRSIIKKAQWLITGHASKNLSIYRCKFLRVVDLKGVVQEFTLPEEIGWLIHLRYLGLTGNRVKELPGSVKKLQNLQTLNITKTKIRSVPQDFWNLEALRHVLATHLENGPKRNQVKSLSNLQTLHGVPWGPWVHKKRKLTNLRSLTVWKLSGGNHCEKFLAYLTSLECLTTLDLQVEDGAGLQLDGLLTMLVLRNLQHLRLHGPVQTAAAAAGGRYGYLLPSLSKLELLRSGLDQQHINMIADLPNLHELYLGEESYMYQDMCIPRHGFRELRKLRFRGLPELVTWHVESGDSVLLSFKHLKHMRISHCAKLEAIPDCLQKLARRARVIPPRLAAIPHSTTLDKEA